MAKKGDWTICLVEVNSFVSTPLGFLLQCSSSALIRRNVFARPRVECEFEKMSAMQTAFAVCVSPKL